ncbi:bifunctional helix-turn-helix transcriptional regulator/GNAT family N-acetyltransferase [Kaistia terrae]|uniref:GNAT family N-acetyltransferase n=1 Tax=Kaistia terrae TaxID=537017 RepID=A0ABW0PZ36_9HYPH|nr:helix-turn-helix domain-containing GNAT family N-acetyltransferase [Kaistia terrae]MCX5580570.1 helix-turn-helix domain-containing GNAT family N-acetyltransferase [Kaistia terrae]
MSSVALVDEIRSASRGIVRELGFMDPTLAGTAYSASAVHALLEVERRGSMTAAQLVQVLKLEKSSISRMLGKLIGAGELMEAAGDEDGRVKPLMLTAQGQRTVAGIHAFARDQVTAALAHLNPAEQQAVALGLSSYARALAARDPAAGEAAAPPIEIVTGYQPGWIGRVAEMHATHYSRHWGFGQFFESTVASGAAEFTNRLENPRNQAWAAIQNGRIVGSIAIDGEDLGDNQAHLRWFILDEVCRGGGVGRRLLSEAVAFCDQAGFAATQLWTMKGLDAARRLYEAHGFELAKEWLGTQWGAEVIEQQFSRRRPGGGA